MYYDTCSQRTGYPFLYLSLEIHYCYGSRLRRNISQNVAYPRSRLMRAEAMLCHNLHSWQT